MNEIVKEKRIGLVSNLVIGKNDRTDEMAIVFTCQFGECLATRLRIVGQRAAQAIVDFGSSNFLCDVRACYVVSLEADGSFGSSDLVDFAGFVEP